jgi:hypothetical protein
MKITLGLGYLAVGQLITDVALDRNDTIARITEKRYQQLITQMNFYNKDFDARRFWAYGCNCLILGDRPMSEAGLGPPVDDLDASCKKYKECLKVWSNLNSFSLKLSSNLRYENCLNKNYF